MIIWLSVLLLTQPAPSLELADGEVFVWPDEATEHLELDELVLGEQSSLNLPEFKSIRIKKLVSKDKARIQIANNSSGADAPPGGKGDDGAEVFLFIDSIDGHVLVEAKGGNGGDGRNGRHGQQGASGGKGRNAFRIFFFYFGKAEDGYPGARGEDGENGEDGGSGGKGGRVHIYFKEKSAFAQILVEVDGGKGGKGGAAGLGGLGGNGGPGGRGSPNGQQGPMGQPGHNGRPGRPGEPGSPGTVKIFQVDGELYRCLLEVYLFGTSSGCVAAS